MATGVDSTVTADSLFEEHLRDGGPTINVSTTADGTRVCRFEDGGTMQAQPSGHFLHKWADGHIFQFNPNGVTIAVDTEGNKTTKRPNGTKVVQSADGTSTTYLATGQQIIAHPDGTRTQIDVDGSGLVLSDDNQIIRRFKQGFDAANISRTGHVSNSRYVAENKQKNLQQNHATQVPLPTSIKTQKESDSVNTTEISNVAKSKCAVQDEQSQAEFYQNRTSGVIIPTSQDDTANSGKPNSVTNRTSAATSGVIWDSLTNSWHSPPSSPVEEEMPNLRELQGQELRKFLESICGAQRTAQILSAGVTGDDLCDFEDSDFEEFGLSTQQRNRIVHFSNHSPSWQSKEHRCVLRAPTLHDPLTQALPTLNMQDNLRRVRPSVSSTQSTASAAISGVCLNPCRLLARHRTAPCMH